MNASEIISFAKELREKLDHLNQLKQSTQEKIQHMESIVGEEAKQIKEKTASEASSYIKAQKEELETKLGKIRTTISNAGITWPSVGKKDFGNFSIDQNRQMLSETIKRIEQVCDELNGIDFDQEIHPVEYSVDSRQGVVTQKDLRTGQITPCMDADQASTRSAEKVNKAGKLYNKKIVELSALLAEAYARIDAIGDAYYASLGIDAYCRKIDDLQQETMANYKAQSNSQVENAVNDTLLHWNRLNQTFFDEIARSKREDSPALCDPVNCTDCSFDFCDRRSDEYAAQYGTTDMRILCGNCSYYDKAGKFCSRRHYCGTTQFKRSICIGDLRVSFGNQKRFDKELIAQSDLLKRYCSDGSISGPMTLDLKKNGNLFIEEAGDCSENTISFIHQYIQYFLLMQPSCRVNLCLVDCKDQCKFSRYSQLTALNSNALFKGIVRNEREIDGIIADMEKTMFDISDNKLSFNNVEDVFEYNDKSTENPQSMHLMVLMDFPEKYAVDTISHIEKIISNGNASGIYTIIVHNPKAAVDFGSRKAAYETSLASIKKNSLVMAAHHTNAGVGYLLENSKFGAMSDFRVQFTPDTGFNSDNFTKNILPILSGNAQKQTQTTIKMKPMFDLTDTVYAAMKRKDPLLPSKLIEIPVGKNGGEVQSLKFSTTGDNAAHALVIGGTGSGKSNLLHALILSACYRYSAEELQIYLIDFKGGVEFKFYEAQKDVARQLPHIALTGLTSEPEDGVAILTNIRSILKERENLFRRNDVEDIVQYNEKYPNQILSRLLVIIDEVQELFAHEKLSQQALVILGELFKKGRAFGISILWASQTVPKATGGDFKDKVLSQIGNRICLKLNNPDDAEVIGISASKVRALNRPEKGLGIIYDGMEALEFRVAFAEKKEDRYDLVGKINQHWGYASGERKNRKPLFIVGDDEVPLAKNGASKYAHTVEPVRSSKSNDTYEISVGQDYISGDPFEPKISLRGSKENILIAGKDIAAMRDIIGYAMLSVALENRTNSDMDPNTPAIYCFNGELLQNGQVSLFDTLSERLGGSVVKMQSNPEFVDQMLKLYKLRKDRYDHMAQVHTPIFVFVHKMQILAEMFADNKSYSVSEEENNQTSAPIPEFGFSGFSGGGNRLTFRDIMQELVARGSDVGIHFVLTMNDPMAIPELRKEFRDFAYKIILNGVSNDSVSQITDNYLLREKTPNKEGVGFCYQGNEMAKFKLYRYDAGQDAEWLSELLGRY